MKRLIMIILAATIAMPVFADGKLRVAVFDPISAGASISEGTKIAVREIISSTIVNAGDYNIVERSLLDKIMQEQQFTNSGVVNDSDAVEIGKLTGANKIVLSLISPAGVKKGQYILSLKIVDVKTASVDKQKVQMMTANNCLDVAASLTNEILGNAAPNWLQSNWLQSKKKADKAETEKEPKKKAEKQPAEPKKAEKPSKKKGSEFKLYLAPGYMPENESHKDNPIEVLVGGKYAGKGTLSEGFDIDISDKKPKKYRLEFRPTSTSDQGNDNTKYGITIFNIDTHYKTLYEFEIQSQRKGKWTIYTVVGK